MGLIYIITLKRKYIIPYSLDEYCLKQIMETENVPSGHIITSLYYQEMLQPYIKKAMNALI